MEFTEKIEDENFIFTKISENNLLVTGNSSAYIIYRSGTKWRCADEIPPVLLKKIGEVIDRHLGITSTVK